MDDRICVWPDGTWCYYGELEGYLAWMSDDYEVMSVNSEEGHCAIGEC